MKSPALTLPGTRDALMAINKTIETCDVPKATLELVAIRVGQINGCAVCVDMHSRALKKLGESDQRVFNAATWRETPYYTDAERAALALAESATRIADTCDAVPDAVWNGVTAHFNDNQIQGLVFSIALANLWNRLNVATRQITGDWIAQYI
jgi:AhpD family alkylhydroperoxidase